MSDEQFDQDLRSVLLDDAPRDVPEDLRRRVAAVPVTHAVALTGSRPIWRRPVPLWAVRWAPWRSSSSRSPSGGWAIGRTGCGRAIVDLAGAIALCDGCHLLAGDIDARIDRLAGSRGQPPRRRRDHQHGGRSVLRARNPRVAAGRRARPSSDRLHVGRSEWPAPRHADGPGLELAPGGRVRRGPGRELLRARGDATHRYRIHLAVGAGGFQSRGRHPGPVPTRFRPASDRRARSWNEMNGWRR